MSDTESDHLSDDEEKKKQLEDIRNPEVVTKYQLAAGIANRALAQVISEAKAGARIVDICEASDNFINSEVKGLYKKDKKLTKGVGFPTCISVNNIVGSFSPMNDDTTELADGDVAKIDLAVQIDGFCAQVAHTIVVGDGEITGRKADLLAAVDTAYKCAQRLLKPGIKNIQVTEIFDKVAKEFKVNTVEGVFSHQVKRFEIDADKIVDNNIPEVPLTGENKTKECEFEAYETWALDIVMSTGNGRPSQLDDRSTTVFRRGDSNYRLKMAAPRQVLHEVDTRFPTFPFTARALQFDERKRRFGLVNCVRNELLDPYRVLQERKEDFVAHVKFTVLLMPNGSTLQITGQEIDMSRVNTEIEVQNEDIKQVLALSIPKKKKKNAKKKKKKKKKAAAQAS